MQRPTLHPGVPGMHRYIAGCCDALLLHAPAAATCACRLCIFYTVARLQRVDYRARVQAPVQMQARHKGTSQRRAAVPIPARQKRISTWLSMCKRANRSKAACAHTHIARYNGSLVSCLSYHFMFFGDLSASGTGRHRRYRAACVCCANSHRPAFIVQCNQTVAPEYQHRVHEWFAQCI